MPEFELEAGEIAEVIDPENVELGVDYYIRGVGSDYRIAKRKRYLRTSSGFTFPDTTGVPVTPHQEGWGEKDGIYIKNTGEEPMTVEWQKKGLEFGFISLGQQKSAASQSNALFERDNDLDIANGDVLEIDLTSVSRQNLEVAFNLDSAVDVDVNLSNSGDFNGEEWTADTIKSGDYTAGSDVVKGYNVNTFRYVQLDFKASGTAGDSGKAEISGSR